MTIERIIGTRSHVEFVNVFERTSFATTSETIELLRNWAHQYLNEPHRNLGRAGPVCPFAGPSVERRLFWAGIVESDNVDFTSMSAIVEDMADIFPELSPRDGKDAILKAIVAVFPNMADFDIIDTVQAHGKSKFIKNGLMLGQFYPGCLEPGLWNDDFRPLDAPLPMLAVRQMVSTDYPFLTARSEWMAAYLKRFAPTVPSPARAFIVAKMGS
ncbi:DUF6875 domain-containing protein [Rhodococcus sp. NPDC059968]|uniref:DUF6875 domain-containing protein n=1 Tax=Rhodococcus sp. NPDC059968 TaxID=3347017 RepID=UPI003671D98E